jgi:hypothetical protein
MAPTAQQTQQFYTLRDELAGHIKVLLEEEYRGLQEGRKYRGIKFFEHTATASDIWYEMMRQWDPNIEPQ